MPGTLPTPDFPLIAYDVGTVPAGTYQVQFTALNYWGETDASVASVATVDGTQSIVIGTFGVPGATSYRAYIGNRYWEAPASNFPLNPINITSLTTGTIGVLPLINRAYLPDTDGQIFPANTVFGWLREALKLAADITGGIYDATGVCTSNNIAMYQVDGMWKKFTHAWWDGWQLGLGNKGDAFYRNKISATSGIVFTDVRGKNAIVEYYPVPNRTGGTTLLSGGISATDTTIPVVNITGFFLAYGLAVVDSEVVAYQSLAADPTPALTGNLVGCLRGMGGTVAAVHTAGAYGQVRELNGRFAGYRYPVLPRVGDSAIDLDVPASWDAWLPLYIESRYRETERRFSDAKALRSEFEAGLKRNASSVRAGLLMGPRQIGEQYVNEVYGSGAKMGGGWLLP